jgi:acyl-CoA oxidase
MKLRLTHFIVRKSHDWCKILAKENLGNMAYPKEYGGGENIEDYFAIIENIELP